ncbi:MAG: hypothetical protein H0V29_13625 [Thermoleophilaceae bacterium]|nr:hypothetical protein [Thermoleophilaceae bacterium]
MSAVTARVGRRLGSPGRRTLLLWAGGLGLAGLGALWEARQAGVSGPAAVADVTRAALATIFVFGLCGHALARALVPERLQPYRLLFVLPSGAVASGLALTLLGFAAVPFHLSLAVVLVGAALSAFAVHRRYPKPAPHADGMVLGALAVVAVLVTAIALLPTFRSGVATVTGYGSDAHLAVGSTTLLQHAYPNSTQTAYPVDEVQIPWRSKYPIFYSLAAVSSVSGLEPWQALMTVTAILLAIAGLGFFLLARHTFGAAAGVAVLAGAAAVLDRMVFHLATHPYYNQMWGLLTLPFALVLADEWVRKRERRAGWLLALMLAGGVFAYPLMLPFPALILAGVFIVDRRKRKARGEEVAPLDPRRLWRGPKSLIWMIPLGLLLLVPIQGVLEKLAEGIAILGDPSNSLVGWRGDVTYYPNLEFFLGAGGVPGGGILALGVLALGAYGLSRQPRRLAIPYAVVLGLALLAAVYFRNVTFGEYFYYKTLSFAGPLIVVIAVVAAGSLLWRRSIVPRIAALAVLGLFGITALAAARDEVATSFDQLTVELRDLRDWGGAIPAGASVRLDTPQESQLWQSYMLSEHPLGSRSPNNTHPHVPVTQGADYALDAVTRPPPGEAAKRPGGGLQPPVFANADWRLWKLDSKRRDTTSRAQVPEVEGITLGDPGG